MWAGRGYEVEPGKDKNEKVKRDAATQLRPAEASGKNAFLPRNDRSYGLKRNVFQTENALVCCPAFVCRLLLDGGAACMNGGSGV